MARPAFSPQFLKKQFVQDLEKEIISFWGEWTDRLTADPAVRLYKPPTTSLASLPATCDYFLLGPVWRVGVVTAGPRLDLALHTATSCKN